MSEHLIGEKDSGDLAMQSGSASVRRAMRRQGKQEALEDVSIGPVSSGLACTWLSEPSLPDPSTIAGTQDPPYLFARHLACHYWRKLLAYQALVAAFDDSVHRVRVIAEMMLHRYSPRRRRESRGVFPD